MHQHGPNCRHGNSHPHGHHGPQGLGFSPQLQQMPPDEYFKALKTKYQQKRQFFWHQILSGLAADKFYEKYGLNFMRSLSCQMVLMLVGSLQMAINFEFIPLRLKHITTGMFFPILFLLFFNYNVVVGVAGANILLKTLSYITMIAYLLVGFRGSGNVNGEDKKQKTKSVYQIRPYLENPQMSCAGCQVIKIFRSMHCPVCKHCVPKFTRHSVVFASCIGAANELLAFLFFSLLCATQLAIIIVFALTNKYGLITKLMFYGINLIVCWLAFKESAGLLVLNISCGITEHELKTWPMQQYLIKIPQRQFQNNVTEGLFTNLINSVISLFGIRGYESVNHNLGNPLGFPPSDPTNRPRINWEKAFFYLVPHIPFHKNRQEIIQMLQRDEERMIEMFKLQQKFKEEVAEETKGENLNQFQMQQRIAMKMQAHMMKNMPQMMQPTIEQQKKIQLQMLSHMKKQFVNEPDLAEKMNDIQKELTEGKINPIQSNMRMRQVQQQLMGRRMEKMMKEKGKEGKGEKKEEEEVPMKVSDQDL